MSEQFDFDTQAVRAGIQRSAFNEHSEALYLTSSFVFRDAAQAAARFSNEEPGYVYSRFSNPTVTAFQERLAALEGGEACVATASGMSAILACAMGLLKSGDHIVSSSSIFGATVQLFGTVLGRFGVDTTFVAGADPGGRLDVEQLADEGAVPAIVGAPEDLAITRHLDGAPVAGELRKVQAIVGAATRERALDGEQRAVPGGDGAAHGDGALPRLVMDDEDRRANLERRPHPFDPPAACAAAPLRHGVSS